MTKVVDVLFVQRPMIAVGLGLRDHEDDEKKKLLTENSKSRLSDSNHWNVR